MAIRPTQSVHALLGAARSALGMTQKEFGEALGVSHRTATRWDAGKAEPADFQLRTLAGLLLPVSRALAVECAAQNHESLVDLGLEKPPAPPAPPPPPPPPPPLPYTTDDLVDIVVCAAAEATDASPRAVRQLLHVAFRRARDVGLTVQQVESALAKATAAGAIATPAAAAPMAPDRKS